MAYTATFTATLPTPERISRNLAVITGTVNLSEYHATLAEITDITKYFSKGVKAVTAMQATPIRAPPAVLASSSHLAFRRDRMCPTARLVAM